MAGARFWQLRERMNVGVDCMRRVFLSSSKAVYAIEAREGTGRMRFTFGL